LSAVASTTVADVIGVVDGATAAVATAVCLTRVTVSRRRQKIHVRAARQDLELRRDAREVEHSPVDEHLLETACSTATLGYSQQQQQQQ